MNILMLTYQGDQAGSTKSMIYLSKGLASRGHNVFFGCREQSLIYKSLLNSNVTVVPMSFSRLGGRAPAQIAILCREQNIQIINAQSSQDRYAALRARFFHGVKSKIIFTRRQMPNSSRLSGLLSTFGAHRIIAVSAAVADALSRRCVDRSKIEVIHNGIPAEICNNIDEDEVQKLRSRLRIPEGTTVVGCVARKKLQDVLIRACPFLPPETVILLIGPGIQQDWCRIIDKLKPSQRIIMLDYQERILPYYRLLIVSVLPSLIEGLSQTLLESMSVGIPVVASRWGGNPEVVEDGVSGLLFSPTDPIDLAEKVNRILEDHQLAESFRERGRRRVLETFNIEQTVEHTEDCFKRLLDRCIKFIRIPTSSREGILSSSRISAQERQDQILTKAEELFATHGFEGTKFHQIAAACQISEGVVFHFFKSKRELHIAAFSHIIKDNPVLDLPVNKEREKAFQIMAENMLAKCREEPTFLRFLLQIFLSEPGLTRLYYESEAIGNFIKFIKRKIDEGKNKGEYRAVDTDFAVVGFIGIILYTAMSYEFFGPETVKNQSPDKLAGKAVDLFLKGLIE